MYNFVSMNLEQYIGQLLYRHQCVTVPGFGAFLTEINTAFLNESTNSFYPPRKVVSFNSNLKNNDGLLANHIALSEKISYDNAVSTIATEVSRWNSFLDSNEKVTLKNIGDISLNTEKKTVFVPSENTNYLKESFGLNTFVSPSIKREVAKHLDIVEEEIEEEQPVIALPTEKRKTPSYLKYAAVFVFGLAGAGYFGYNFYENRVAEQTLLVETSVQKKMQTKIQQATFLIENPLPSVTLTVKEEKLNYHIVAGAFRNEENATKAYNELIATGYKARRIAPNKHGLYPVLFGSYATLQEANEAKEKIQQAGNPDAWLLVKEL